MVPICHKYTPGPRLSLSLSAVLQTWTTGDNIDNLQSSEQDIVVSLGEEMYHSPHVPRAHSKPQVCVCGEIRDSLSMHKNGTYMLASMCVHL